MAKYVSINPVSKIPKKTKKVNRLSRNEVIRELIINYNRSWNIIKK